MTGNQKFGLMILFTTGLSFIKNDILLAQSVLVGAGIGLIASPYFGKSRL